MRSVTNYGKSASQALALLLRLLEETLGTVIGLCKEQVQQLIERFIATLPVVFRERMLLLAQNSE